MNWEIFTYGSGDQLRMTLTAIASLFGNDDYAMAMMTTATIAFVGYLVIAAFDRQSLSNFRWLIGMIVLYMATVVPKVDVIVNDRVMPANSAVVGNVPIGLAMTAGFFSQIGDYFARSFETVSQCRTRCDTPRTASCSPTRCLMMPPRCGSPMREPRPI